MGNAMRDTFAIGDIHGHPDTLVRLLQEAELIGPDRHWTGADSALWLLGDLTDRGPDGVGVIDLVMRLQREVAASGGEVNVLLGNHDLLILAASPLVALASSGATAVFRADWTYNGGRASDLQRLTPDHARWLANLPAMALVQDHLLIHADALIYADYGDSISAVNQSVTGMLHSSDPRKWDRLLGDFSQRLAFVDPRDGPAQADAFLRQFGGRRILHGHTPIPLVTGEPAATVREPLAYAGGRCLNLDGGIFLGGSGFVYRLPALA
jgi:hypothetical protein